ncbi:tripartite tricarboxylate transporter substrate binding protein [Candidimonas sp. SYP-B2681]|uniref:tripartite tricarboxylate transporter substrate binding protein n=1 Tax=Candidimonas sp. SYP-B2681 TaxID=2497686 RepID=UPI000F87694B|nr:tripartite tricarboxylate transporter substrate binding protein [Candidimonas sp. SYP-B2681]RTZ48210.1 tripartite tricarboxylate transporter substrate binding protein [Candidimonas sp. SYP-B2681]
MKRFKMIVLAGLLTGVTTVATVQAAYPDKPITIIVPYGPGGTTDIVGRALGESLARQLKQPVVIENKPGAAGSMGVIEMMNSKPDGYRLTMAPVGIFRQPYLQQTRYDPIRDLSYIASFLTYDFMVTVAADSPFKTINELVAFAKKNPGAITYGTPGRFTGNQVVLAKLGKEQSIKFVHIPYKGDSEAIAALLGGHTHVAVVTNSVLPFMRSGKVRVLATAADVRPDAFSEMPTMKEAGFNVEVPSPLGLAGPKGMPTDIVNVLDRAVKSAMDEPAFQQVLQNYGVRTFYMDNKVYTKFAETTFKAEKDIIESLGLNE